VDIYREAAKIRQKGGAALLGTLVSVDGDFSKGKGSKVLMRTSGEKIGSLWVGAELEKKILGEAEGLLREKKPKVLVLNSEDRSIEILLEPVFSEPTVYLFGAGHISEQVAPLAKMVDFKVVVIDDREIFANRKRFPDADEVMVSEFDKCFDRFNMGDSSYIVIVTRGHLYDGIVLEQAVESEARYIGMIGSKKKIRTLYESLMKKGISKEILSRVRAPIGIDINSETPEEIAVSIVAELIMVRGEPPHR
jgi:xanthine dehydrogenase accessory factor